MFNALRRGPASMGRVVRIATTSSTPAFRSSRITFPFQNVSRPAISARAIHIAYPLRYQAAVANQEDVIDRDPREREVLPTITMFQELADQGLVHPKVISAITKGMGHETMTDVQQMTINQTLKRTDIIAQAKTGTGKTLGFLIPAVQNIIDNNPELANAPAGYGRADRAMPSDIRTIIISPTRELAEQIAVEAQKITRGTGIVTQVAVGGNSKRAMLMQMQRQGCHLLVATPGRLYDLLSDPYSRVAAPKLNTLILDEADRLLDAGFSQAIEDITKILPDRSVVDRQTLLFSATVPREVMGLVRNTLKQDYEMVRTVKAGEQATHEKVPQKIVECAGMENVFPAMLELCKREVDLSAADPTRPPFKAIVYLNATAMVELAAETFENLKPQGSGQHGRSVLYPCVVSDIHAKLTQQRRQMVADRFRKAKTAILFSTDVTARGMDFPGVTHVIQVGLAPNKEQYIHRVGRTGRGDKSGEGWLFVVPTEVPDCRSRLRGLPIAPDSSLLSAAVDMTRDAQLPTHIAEILSQVGEATKMAGKGLKTAAYGAMGSTMSGEGREIMATLERWSRYGWGWEIPPQLVPGVERRIRSMRQGQTQVYGRRSGGGFGGRDGGRGGFSGGRGDGAGGFGSRDGGGRGGFSGGRGGESGGYGGREGGGRASRYEGSGGSSGGRERGGFGGGDRNGGRSGRY